MKKIKFYTVVVFFTILCADVYAYMWDRDEDYEMHHKSSTETFIGQCISLFILAMITRAVYHAYNKKGPIVGGLIFSALAILSFKNGVIFYGLIMSCFVIYSYLIWNENKQTSDNKIIDKP